MKRIFRTVLVFASLFFHQSKVVAKNENPVIEKANFIQQRIFQEYKNDNDSNRLISYINKHHDLDKIDTEVSDRLEGGNWYNWTNWDTWSNWDTWNTWYTWDTWNTWYTWDNWGNWFNWTNY